MSNLKIKDIENILNYTVKNLFYDSDVFKFKVTETEQLQLWVSKKVKTLNRNFTNRLIKMADSKIVISEIRKDSSFESCSKALIKLLNNLAGEEINWAPYVKLEMHVKEEVIEQAKIVLKEHIEGVREFLIESILEVAKDIDIDKKQLNEIWKENILNKYNVVDKIDSFKSYLTIEEKKSYPYIILGCKTGYIKLSESSSVNFLKVENDENELHKLKETERVLKECSKNIKPFIEVNKLINTIYTLGMSSFCNIEDYYKEYDYTILYENKINKAIRMDLVSGELNIDSEIYNLSHIDSNEIKDIISNLSKQISKDVEEHFKKESIKRKERYNKPYIREILHLIDEFPKKGITTYVSILMGENSSKITSNDYDKSTSYGAMSSFKKTYITDMIRELIASNIINECSFKASFGRYIGLVLSDESKKFISDLNTQKYLDSIEDKKVKIDSFKMLLNELKVLSKSKASALLTKVSEESISFEKSDFNILLEFIEKERALYRDYEETFNSCISKIVPNIYRPLFLLNSNFTSGVNKKTLKAIYDNMEI